MIRQDMHFQSGRGQCLNEDRFEVWECSGTRWQGGEGKDSSLDVFLSGKGTEKAFSLLSPYVRGLRKWLGDTEHTGLPDKLLQVCRPLCLLAP